MPKESMALYKNRNYSAKSSTRLSASTYTELREFAEKAYALGLALERSANVMPDGGFSPEHFSSEESHRKRLAAIEHYSQAVLLDSAFRQAYLRRSVAYSSIGMHSEAERDAREVLKLNPTALECHVMAVALIGPLSLEVLEFATTLSDAPGIMDLLVDTILRKKNVLRLN